MRSDRVATLLWQLVCVLAVGLSALGILTSGMARTSLPPQALTPPYDPPRVTQEMLRTDAVAEALGRALVQTQDGPPDSTLFESASNVGASLRASILVGGWQRFWTTPDERSSVIIQATELRRADLARAFVADECDPGTRIPVAGAVSAGVSEHPDGVVGLCARSVIGRTTLVFLMSTRETDPLLTKGAALSALVLAQVGRVAALPDLGQLPGARTGKNALDRAFALAVVAVPMLFALPTPVIDRATRRRLFRAIRRRSYHPVGFDINPLARRLLAMAAALAAGRVAIYVWSTRLAGHLQVGYGGIVAILLIAFVATGYMERMVRRRSTPRQLKALFSGRRRALAAVGAAAAVTVAAAGLYLVFMGVSIAALGVNPLGADQLSPRLALVLAGAGLLVIILGGLPYALVRRLAMRQLGRQAQEDPRPHVLLLRSFADDRRTLRARRIDQASLLDRFCLRRWERFEEIIAVALGRHGPVIALSEPGERLPPPLGAVRRSFPMNDWQEGVRQLIVGARVVAVTLARTESLLWEIRQIRVAGALHRTVFLLPPLKRSEQRARLAVLSWALGIPWHLLDVPRGRDVLAVAFPSAEDLPFVVISAAPDDVSYGAALEAIASLLLRQGPKPGLPAAQEDESPGRVTHSAAPTSLVGATAAAESPPPRVAVFPRGKAPVYRPVYRRKLTVVWSLVIVVPLILNFALGYDLNKSKTVSFNGKLDPTAIVQDDRDGRVYAVLANRFVVAVDLGETPRVTALARLDVPVDEVSVSGGWMVFLSRTTGTLGVLDLTTRQVAWRSQVDPGARGLRVEDQVVYLALPAGGFVRAFSATNGEQLAEGAVGGVPWDVDPSPEGLTVALADSDEVLQLDPRSLVVRARMRIAPGAKTLLHYSGRPWVVGYLAHSVVPLDASLVGGPQGRILIQSQFPKTSTNAGWLAITGFQRVSTFSPQGQVRRYTLPKPQLSALCVTRDGHVIAGSAGALELLG